MDSQQELYEAWKQNAQFMGTSAPVKHNFTFAEPLSQAPKAGETFRNQFVMSEPQANKRKSPFTKIYQNSN
jgi:hypothetical protein